MAILVFCQVAGLVFLAVVIGSGVREYLTTKSLIQTKERRFDNIAIIASFLFVFLTLLASLIYVVTQ